MTDTEIKTEIIRCIEGTRTQCMPASWIVQSVMQNHAAPEGKDSDFYICCAYGHVRSVVRSTLQNMRKDETEVDSRQMILPGFERLQVLYIVDRDDELQAIPIELLTADELKQKILELRRMARGCIEHADELQRYMSQREAA